MGGLNFRDLQPGEYQLLLADDVQAATREAARDLLRNVDPNAEDFQRVSNALVTIEIHTNRYDGYEELRVAINPHADSVDMSGFPVVIASRGSTPHFSSQIILGLQVPITPSLLGPHCLLR
jgi:hypothetical protein